MQNMTTGNIQKLILKFAIPLFVSQLFQQLYSTVDSIIVGQFLGRNALAAVSSSGPLVYLIVSFFDGASMGAGILIGKSFGAGDDKAVKRAVHTQIVLSLCAGLAITAFGSIFTPALLRLIKVDPVLLPEAIQYFKVFFMGSISLTMYNCFRSIMTSVGDSKRPLYYLIISSCINVCLDYLFVGVIGLGVWSAALATILAQSTSAILCLIYLAKPGKVISVSARDLGLYKDEVRLILKYGLPAGVQNSVIGLANVIVQAQINSFGAIATSTHGIYGRIEGFVFIPIMSFNMSITTFISQNLGAKKYDRAKQGARFGIFSAVILAEVLGLLYYVFNQQLFGLFISNDPDVFALGMTQVHTIVPFYCLLAFSHSIAAVCRGSGKAIVPMGVMLGTWCVIRIAYILSVMHFFGEIIYVYWAYPLTWFLSSVIYLIYYVKSDWVHGFENERRR
ncbi:MAG: MATE family efflux transporter [Clostridia bacterium]|nr:MATE family efflux transporter [Clostridia bacterium]